MAEKTLVQDQLPSPVIRAFVNFDGTPAVPNVTIRRSYNVASIVHNATGDYTINYTNALPNDGGGVSYATVIVTAQRDSDNIAVGTIHGSTTYNQIASTAVTVQVRDNANNLVDAITVCVLVLY